MINTCGTLYNITQAWIFHFEVTVNGENGNEYGVASEKKLV